MIHFLSVILVTILGTQWTIANAAALPPSRNPEYRSSKYFPRTGLEWSDLEVSSVYKLTTPIYYTDTAKRRYLIFPAQSPFRFNQLLPLPQIRSFYYEFIHQSCPYPNLKLDIFIFENVVLTIDPGCIMGLYLESRDYYSPSFWSGNKKRLR
ncbi:MAG: hypothetical protein JNL11_01260 [Bdellovibrionaceae bacterium]|nr:hypothetical protein [Pseudobdellovibrionaceae bacterium]